MLADWVQDHGDEPEAVAIRDRVSVRVDLLPQFEETAAMVGAAAARIAAAIGAFLPALAAHFEALSRQLAAIAPNACSDQHR